MKDGLDIYYDEEGDFLEITSCARLKNTYFEQIKQDMIYYG